VSRGAGGQQLSVEVFILKAKALIDGLLQFRLQTASYIAIKASIKRMAVSCAFVVRWGAIEGRNSYLLPVSGAFRAAPCTPNALGCIWAWPMLVSEFSFSFFFFLSLFSFYFLFFIFYFYFYFFSFSFFV
jgi:hypothetical protein